MFSSESLSSDPTFSSWSLARSYSDTLRPGPVFYSMMTDITCCVRELRPSWTYIRMKGIVKLALSERTYRVELISFALIGRHRLPPARR